MEGEGPWFCLLRGGVLENGARNVGSDSMTTPSDLEKIPLTSRENYFSFDGDLKKLSCGSPIAEALSKNDLPDDSSFLNGGVSLKEKKLSPAPGLELSPFSWHEMSKKLAIACSL